MIMIVEFDYNKSTVTYGGGRFVCNFVKTGFLKKNFEISVFEADINFRPIEPKTPLFVEKMPFDERKIINAMKIICGLDSGSASWIPEKYLSNKHTLSSTASIRARIRIKKYRSRNKR